MKKLVKILVPFLVASSTILSGCKNKNKTDDRVLLSFGDVHATEATEITLQKLNEVVKAKDSFMLVVSTNSCGCWDEFRPNLNKYLSTYRTLCYKVDFNQIKDVASAYGLFLLSSSTTTFAIFENGKLKTSLCSSDDKNIMYDEKKFFQYMEETVRLPGCYFITKDDVATIKESGKNAVIYFERTECGDCTSMNPTILRSYVNDHPNANKIYVLDCQPYWRKSTDADYQSYLDTKDELGLSNVNNPTYGYSSGVFPYFSYIENGAYASGAVIYNDRVEQQDSKYIVTSSYYTSERVASLQYTDTVLVGKELTSNDVNVSDYGPSWTHESANETYKNILNSFLDYALPKVTFTF